MATIKFKDLDSQDKLFIKQVHSNNEESWDDRMSKIQDKFGIAERTARRWIKKLKLVSRETVENEQYKQAQEKVIEKSQCYLITWAQNNTPAHMGLLTNMQRYAEFRGAEIVVIAGRYHNPTSVFSDKEEEYWVKEVLPYLSARKTDLNNNIQVLADIKIQPTAKTPLFGFESLSGDRSTVIGHPRVHLKAVPVFEGHRNKVLMSTGAITLPNYTDSRAGKEAEFHHVQGFIIVEIKDENQFFIRQVTADDVTGDFSDLYHRVEGGEISNLTTCQSIVLGDIHHEKIDESVMEETEFFMERLVPEHIILHDVLDGVSVNPHELDNPIKQYQNSRDDKDDISDEIYYLMEWLKGVSARHRNSKLHIVRSNHDIFLDRYILSDWRKGNPKNSLTYLKYAAILLEDKENKGILPNLIEKEIPEIHCMQLDELLEIGGFVHHHGHVGPNGTKGSAAAFKRLATKSQSAHTHTPERLDGVLVAGLSSKKKHGYNVGPSSWQHAHIITHNDNRAQHILFFDGEFTI